MERIVNLHIEKLPEGVYLATSDDIPGLVAQGRTVAETLEIARDVSTKLLEAQSDRQERPTLREAGTSVHRVKAVVVPARPQTRPGVYGSNNVLIISSANTGAAEAIQAGSVSSPVS